MNPKWYILIAGVLGILGAILGSSVLFFMAFAFAVLSLYRTLKGRSH